MVIPKDPLPFVVKKPGEEGADDMPWDTTVEISVGEKCWYDYLESLNSIMYIDEDDSEYKLIDYSNLYVVTMPRSEGEQDDWPTWHKSTDGTEWIRPLNGYHIFERVYHEKQSDFDHFSDKKINNRRGVVKYVASNNKQYENGMETDHVELQIGDEVQFGAVPPVFLEDEYHCFFDGGRVYRRAQARNVELLWRDGQLILPNGRVLIRQILDEKITKAGIILPRANVKSHRGEIVLSSAPDIEVGDIVKYPKGAGGIMEYKDETVRVVKSDKILYIE